MAIMTMIEDSKGRVWWVCSECGWRIKFKSAFEDHPWCPKCRSVVTDFAGLYNAQEGR